MTIQFIRLLLRRQALGEIVASRRHAVVHGRIRASLNGLAVFSNLPTPSLTTSLNMGRQSAMISSDGWFGIVWIPELPVLLAPHDFVLRKISV
jgi:hypothetical protein